MRVFGFFGPILGGLLSLLIAFFSILFLKVLNLVISLPFLGRILDFLQGNLLLFFLLSLCIGYANLFLKHRNIAVLSPLLSSIAGVMILYIVLSMMAIVNADLGIGMISVISGALLGNMTLVLLALLVISYLGYLIEMIRSLKS